MKTKKRILLKITGSVFLDPKTKTLSSHTVNGLIAQMKELSGQYQFGLVVGGGNFFRGSQYSKPLGIEPAVAHQIGMLATLMNGLILHSLFKNQDMPASLFCATPTAEIGLPISQQAINVALANDHTLIFAGGTGNPFFTTDTNAVLRSLQIDADEIWKGTDVDGVYNHDPRTNPDAQQLKSITFVQAIQQRLGVMDLTAYAMAEQYKKKIRVFNIFTPNALIRAIQDQQFGSILISS